ncbi:MAG: peroxidase-related enzyme, partial [Phycisphaeraceae bacterium]|nr:peroxidase-related enzyme [Phycisphaeraceae bacterium]
MSRVPCLDDRPHLRDVFRCFPKGLRPLLEYHDAVLRGDSPLSVGERELIAAYVSGLNACSFCAGSHRTIAESAGIDGDLFDALMEDVDSSPLEDRLKPIFRYVRTLTKEPAKATDQMTADILRAGWPEEAVYDAVCVCALFNFMNRLVEGMGVETDEA